MEWFQAQISHQNESLGSLCGNRTPRVLSSFCDQLDRLKVQSAICCRDNKRGLCGFNDAARTWLGIETATLGSRLDEPVSHWHSRLDELSERMLRFGAITIRFTHQQTTPQGKWFEWATIKARLPSSFSHSSPTSPSSLLSNDFGILSMSRPITPIHHPVGTSFAHLEELFRLFRKLDEIDQEICHGIALGDTTCEIAQAVGLTRRTVEVRRGKIMELFGFSRKVQIVRLIVRLEENGYFDEL